VTTPIDFYAEIVATLTMVLVSIAILRSYFKDPDRDKRTLALSIGYLFFALATISGFSGILLVLMDYPANAPLALNVERFVYVFVAFGMVPFTYFVMNLFFRGARWPTYLMTIFAIILSAVYLLVQSSVVGESVTGSPTVWNTDLLSGLALLLMTSVVFLVLFVKCFQTAGKTKEPLVKRRFRIIGLAAFVGILIFIVSAFTVLGGPLIPYISATSWSLSAIAGILSYVGWVRFKGPRTSKGS
jgi:succinate dehydrogenase hydrophobic anchor subunit